MWILKDGTITRTKQVTIDGVTYPPQMFNNSELRKSLGIKRYKEIQPEARYYTYSSDSKTLTETDDEVVATYEAMPRLLDDRLEVDEDGNPMLDSDGKQIITRGLKSALKDKVSQKYKAMMVRPEVDTGLGFSVDGSYADLKNFETGKEYGILQVKDVDGVFHDINIEDYDTIIKAIKEKGIELFTAKWNKELEVDAISSIDELKAFEDELEGRTEIADEGLL